MDKLTQAREALIAQIDSLLAMNKTGQVSHRVPGLAVDLLTRSRDALAALSDGEAVEPVAWQRRLKYPDGPGAIAQWETCGAEEANGHFERSPRHEYRCLYASPPDQSDGALRAENARLRAALKPFADASVIDDTKSRGERGHFCFGKPAPSDDFYTAYRVYHTARATEGGQNDER